MNESVRSFAEPIAALRTLFAAVARESEAATAALCAGDLVVVRALAARLAECDRAVGELAGAIADHAATHGVMLERRADSLDAVIALDQRLAAHRHTLARRDEALALLPRIRRLEYTRHATELLAPLAHEVARARVALEAGEFALAEALLDGQHPLTALLTIVLDRDTLAEAAVAELSQRVAASALGSRIAIAAIMGRIRLGPVVATPEPVVATPEPVVAIPEPVVAIPEPVVAIPEPVVARNAPGSAAEVSVTTPRVSREQLQRLSEHFRPRTPPSDTRTPAGPSRGRSNPTIDPVRDERSILQRVATLAREYAQFVNNQISGTRADLSEEIDRPYAAAFSARARRSSWPMLAGCYMVVADAAELASKVLATPHRELPEPLIRLLAWVQSILRSAVAESLGGGVADITQLMLYNLLGALCRRRRIFLAQHMSLDTQAPVSDLSAAIEEFKRLRAQPSGAPAAVGRPSRQATPREQRGAARMAAPVANAGAAPQASSPTAETQLQRVARWLRGRSILFIGGERRPEHIERHTRTFGLREFIWATGDRGPTPSQFEADIKRDDVAVVVLAIRWSRHSFGDIQQTCDRYNKPLVRLRAGYNERELARMIDEQAGNRLALDITT